MHPSAPVWPRPRPRPRRVPRTTPHFDLSRAPGDKRERVPAGAAVLDMMSSWVSHLASRRDVRSSGTCVYSIRD